MNANPSESASAPGRHRERFATGRVLAGRYELLDHVGAGGTADVFKALDHRLDRVVAVKVLRPEFGQDANARTRFAVEARSAGALNVPNIVPVYDFGAADDGSLFIVMRFIDGPSLRRVLADHGRLPLAAALDVGRQIAEALAAAHTHGLIHRDVKPGNILIDREGTAHLTDFGTVKALAGAEDLTRSGTIFGTAAYLSPEQVSGAPIGPYTDVYSLGVVLYEALAGQPPFHGDDPVAVSYRHAHELPRPLGEVAPAVDREVGDLVMSCLAKDPAQRPSDAARLASVLDSASRRFLPRGGGTRLLAQLASDGPLVGVGGGSVARAGRSATPERLEPDKETVPLPQIPKVELAPLLPGVPAPPVAPPIPRPKQFERPVIERGVVVLPGWHREATRRRGGSAFGTALLIGLLALFVIASIWMFTSLLTPRGDDPGFAVAPTSSPSPRAPRSTPPAVVITPPTVTPTPVPLTPPPPTAPPLTPGPPTEAPVPTPVATPVPTPVATPVPTPVATPVPTPVATPVPPPRPIDVTQRIPDGRFRGDFHGDENGTYHGRSSSWVYGQGTPFHTMIASFSLETGARPVGRAALELVGLDGENPVKNMVRIVLNGVTLYEGPNPLPDDFCCGGSGPGNWGSAVLEFPADLLAAENSLSIANLEPTDCTSCPKFVMVDFVELRYRAQP